MSDVRLCRYGKIPVPDRLKGKTSNAGQQAETGDRFNKRGGTENPNE